MKSYSMERTMNIQSIIPAPVEARVNLSSAADALQRDRDQVGQEKALEQVSSDKKKQVQSEELLQNIKALTDNGTYSVRFETYQDTEELVINLVDSKTGETIRQIPPKEILGMHKALADLRGNIVETQS
jgi:flagellar protein FlaG